MSQRSISALLRRSARWCGAGNQAPRPRQREQLQVLPTGWNRARAGGHHDGCHPGEARGAVVRHGPRGCSQPCTDGASGGLSQTEAEGVMGDFEALAHEAGRANLFTEIGLLIVLD